MFTVGVKIMKNLYKEVIEEQKDMIENMIGSIKLDELLQVEPKRI